MTHLFHPSILRDYDVRGVVGRTLGPADAHAVGRGLGAGGGGGGGGPPRGGGGAPDRVRGVPIDPHRITPARQAASVTSALGRSSPGAISSCHSPLASW